MAQKEKKKGFGVKLFSHCVFYIRNDFAKAAI